MTRYVRAHGSPVAHQVHMTVEGGTVAARCGYVIADPTAFADDPEGTRGRRTGRIRACQGCEAARQHWERAAARGAR